MCHYHEHACALHFHHWREKHFAISQGLRKPIEEIIAEMQICTLLCANCHSVIHFDDDAPRSEVWKEMAAIKLQRGCAKCGYNEHSCALHFHHWGQKDFDISLGLRKPKDVLYAEVKKCSVLCSRCHAVLQYCVRKRVRCAASFETSSTVDLRTERIIRPVNRISSNQSFCSKTRRRERNRSDLRRRNEAEDKGS